jgi:hypothetical protein
MKTDVDGLAVEAFQPRVGERFRICPNPDSAVDAELVEARPLSGGVRVANRRAPFALLFRTTLGVPMPQRIYRVEHDAMGAYDIFLVPVGKDATGVLYEAIFT